MNSLIIPPAPNWYENTVFVCAPDNTVIYGSRSDLVVIKPKDLDQPADIQIIPRAHQDKIKSIAVCPAWGKKKLVASLAMDKTVKLWNMEDYSLQLCHRGHTSSSTEAVGVCFAGNDRTVSVSVDGLIIIWRFGPNELVQLKDLLGIRPKVTCLSTCPHLNWMVAFGLSNGLVVITDLRKTGKVLYKLRRHDEAIVSFSWCPADYNVIYNQANTTSTLQSGNSSETTITSVKSSDLESDECDIEVVILDSKSGYSRPIPQHFDISDNIFVEELESSTNVLQVNIFDEDFALENREYVAEQNEGLSRAACAALKQQVLRSIQSEETVAVDKEKVQLGKEQGSTEKLEDVDKTPEKKVDVHYYTPPESPQASDGSELQTENDTSVSEAGFDEKDFLTACAALKKQILIAFKKEVQASQSETPPESTSKEMEQTTSLAATQSIASSQPEKVPDEVTQEVSVETVTHSNQIETLPESTAGGIEKPTEVAETQSIKQPNAEELPTSNGSVAENVDTSAKSDRKEFLLASSSKGGNVICIWSVGINGRQQAELHLSGRAHAYKKRGAGSSSWIALHWIAPTILLSSSKQGELLSWNLKYIKGKGLNLKPTLVHNDHISQLFCIASPYGLNKEEEEKNWRKESELKVWTMGQDRYILYTNLDSSREVFISYPTIGGAVHCLSQSPLDPNRVAIGIGDNTTRVWDLSKPHLQYIIMSKLWQGMNGKVFSLAWHPTKEAILAYGTFEGRIGMADTFHSTKQPVLFTQYFNKGIYHLQWGPLKGETEFGLYACSEGKVVVYNKDKPIEDPCVIPTPENEQITQFIWNSSYNILTLGAKTGTLFFYSADFKLLRSFYYQQKAVQCLVWHPDACVDTSNYFAWLASATNGNNIVIYNCSCLFSNDGSGDKDVSIVADLLGHSGSVKCLSWSPHEGNKLVSVGEDSIAQVWDVSTKTLIATYLGHGTDGILSVLWSPLDPDFIITGGRDNTLRIWKVSSCPPVQLTALESAAKAKNKSEKSDNVDENKTESAQAPSKTKRVLDTVSRENAGVVSTIIDDCRRLFLSQQGAESSHALYKLDALDIFKTRDDVLKLLDDEMEKHLRTGKRLQAHHISLWKGDISETIKQAIANGTVTPFLISLAPMVSPKLWQEACETYSKKLTESSKADPLEIAAYFLACHKVEQAIEALVTGSYFREALALAKSRLGEQDSLVTSILERWATAAMFDGNFEISAQCYIALGKLEEAVKLLFRRSDETSLKLALDIAEHVNNEDLYKAVSVRYNAFKNEKEQASTEESMLQTEAVLGGGDCDREKQD